jgi:hypothetical protein
MIFNIVEDSGKRIVGTLIPSSVSDVVRVRVLIDGEDRGLLNANLVNKSIRDLGFHETGLVDFLLNEEFLPGLTGYRDVELRDAATDLMIYRRFRPGMVERKILRLETQMMPAWRFDGLMHDRFQQYYRRIESLGLNTTRQLFLLSQKSIWLAGRIQIQNFLYCFEQGFGITVLLRDPYEELAERFLVLKMLATSELRVLDERERHFLTEPIAWLAGVDLDNPSELRRAIGRMPIDIIARIANPLLRQLSTSEYGEQPNNSGIARALDLLSECAVVGLRSDIDPYIRCMAELTGTDIDPASAFPAYAKTDSLAGALRDMPAAELLVEKDLELYRIAADAYRTAGASAGETR